MIPLCFFSHLLYLSFSSIFFVFFLWLLFFLFVIRLFFLFLLSLLSPLFSSQVFPFLRLPPVSFLFSSWFSSFLSSSSYFASILYSSYNSCFSSSSAFSFQFPIRLYLTCAGSYTSSTGCMKPSIWDYYLFRLWYIHIFGRIITEVLIRVKVVWWSDDILRAIIRDNNVISAIDYATTVPFRIHLCLILKPQFSVIIL